MLDNIRKFLLKNKNYKSVNEYVIDYALGREEILDHKDEIIFDLAKMLLRSTSTGEFRQIPILALCGHRGSIGKFGYDSSDGNIEVKSIVYSPNNKLNGGGSYSDLTWARHKKYVDDDVRLVLGGFVDGRIVYVIEVKYSDIVDRIEYTLKDALPDGDKVREYSRASRFTYCAYDKFEIKYLHSDIEKYKYAICDKFYKLLTKK